MKKNLESKNDLISVYYFNPKKHLFKSPLRKIVPIKRNLNNFGDILTPLIIKSLLKDKIKTLNIAWGSRKEGSSCLLAVGSILHYAQNKNIIWGTGRNGKISDEKHNFSELDVRAVRGPLTQSFLHKKGINAPDIYGDPALLLPTLFPNLVEFTTKPLYEVTYIPNYNDLSSPLSRSWAFSPLNKVNDCLKRITQSQFVIASSLHGVIIAEAFGIPARVIKSTSEDDFKFIDYFEGTGRTDVKFARTPEEAIELGGQPKPVYSQEALINSFPYDLFV